ncbi:helix-turn-helix domain-containing protein [Paenibacillus sp. N1-5-1-14]|uniref:helix-turn-helix domain-containing protein n=1 Tax=Paenibacillus radicibacter TaxID=2972488 RepID=UPI002158B8A7|nr:helix-turn-helix domain-containing protein [Paenibacillus radicibacter]MCR8641997.1 helix-turn-helix domain-containing protein [Paenibacillus radicibacter]
MLTSLVHEAKNHNPQAMEGIISMFAPKLKKSLYQTTQQQRDDLKQDVCLKIMEVVHRYDLEAVPGFFEYLKETELDNGIKGK